MKWNVVRATAGGSQRGIRVEWNVVSYRWRVATGHEGGVECGKSYSWSYFRTPSLERSADMLTSLSELFCKCAALRVASAALHGACKHRPKAMCKTIGPRLLRIGESSAREARAKVLVYIYIYIYIYKD